MSSPWVPALITGGAAVLVGVLANITGFYVQRDKLRQELRTEFMAEQAIVQLLSHKTWNLRSFRVISKHVGGFQDDELRRLLVRAGALRFTARDGSEAWGLRDRNRHLLDEAGSADAPPP